MKLISKNIALPLSICPLLLPAKTMQLIRVYFCKTVVSRRKLWGVHIGIICLLSSTNASVFLSQSVSNNIVLTNVSKLGSSNFARLIYLWAVLTKATKIFFVDAVNSQEGNDTIPFNTAVMYRNYEDTQGNLTVSINKA